VNYTVDFFREQFEELLEKLHLIKEGHQMCLIGHSMGGLVSSEFAARRKDLVSKIVLLNSPGLPVKKSLNHFMATGLQFLMGAVRGTSLLHAFASSMAKLLKLSGNISCLSYEDLCHAAWKLSEDDHLSKSTSIVVHKRGRKWTFPSYVARLGRNLDFLFKTWCFQVLINEQRHQVFTSVVNNCPLLEADYSRTFCALHKMEDEYFLTETVESLQTIQIDGEEIEEDSEEEELYNNASEERKEDRSVPVLIIWGEDDGLVPVTIMNEIKKCIPSAQVVSIPHSDHGAFLQRPYQIFDLMSKFLLREESC